MSIIENLEKLLARGEDSDLLRYSLGNEYRKAGQPERAVEHLAVALDLNPGYSAAWKIYGRALADTNRLQEASAALAKGIEVAEHQGDLQAAKEMGVFLKRIRKQLGS